MSFAFTPGARYLEPGFHDATVQDVEATLVNGFVESTTRRDIFERWTRMRSAIAAVVSLREQWLDGSYVTTKIDPDDADVVVHLDGDEVENLDTTAEFTLQALVAGKQTQATWRCDSYPLVEYPEGHPLREAFERQRSYWADFFGKDREGNPKGIVRVEP
jgi:hypothetical protein